MEPKAADQQIAAKREHHAKRGGNCCGSMVACAPQPQPDQQNRYAGDEPLRKESRE